MRLSTRATQILTTLKSCTRCRLVRPAARNTPTQNSIGKFFSFPRNCCNELSIYLMFVIFNPFHLFLLIFSIVPSIPYTRLINPPFFFSSRFWTTGFIHDLGKILAHPKFGGMPQWCVVGDTFPVGCAFSDRCVYPDT